MKKFQKNRKICIVFLLIIISCFKTEAQTYSCSYESMNYQIDCSQSTLKSAYFQNLISEFKTIRVNIHFILKDDGTGNFTETTNVYGESSSEDGYWFADYFVIQPQNVKSGLSVAELLPRVLRPRWLILPRRWRSTAPHGSAVASKHRFVKCRSFARHWPG